MHILRKDKEWAEYFPRIDHLLGCSLTCVYDELGKGDTTQEILTYYVAHERADNVFKLLEELNEFLLLVEKGEIDPDQYLEEVDAETMYDWDRLAASNNLTTSDYFKLIRSLLIENIKKQYGKQNL